MSGVALAMLGAVSQGVLWGLMVLGVYITYKILDIADRGRQFCTWRMCLCGDDRKQRHESDSGNSYRTACRTCSRCSDWIFTYRI